MELIVNIDTDNEGMASPQDAANALRWIADRIESPDSWRGNVRDVNGNTVGRYSYTPAAPEPEDIDSGRYTAEQLEALPTLHEAQADDCKVDTGAMRVWLSRCTVEDGEPYDNKITIERLVDGTWNEVDTYPG